jgi:hypothetical protein
MDSNTHSTKQPTSPSARQSDGLAAFTAAVDALAAQNLNGLPDPVRAQRVLGLRGLLDRLEGHGLAELAAVDARGAAGADQGLQAPPPPVGCGPASGWAPAPPPAACGPPGPCSAAP